MCYYDYGIISGGKESGVEASRNSIESLCADSYRLIELCVCDHFKINARKDGKETRINNWGSHYVKTTAINMCTTSDCSSSADCNDYNSCTIDRCSDGDCVHAPIDCNDCGTNITTSINTNEKVEDLSWAVENTNKKRVIVSSNTTLGANQTYLESKCLEFSDYNFIISYATNDAESNNITHKAQSEGSTLFQGSTNQCL